MPRRNGGKKWKNMEENGKVFLYLQTGLNRPRSEAIQTQHD